MTSIPRKIIFTCSALLACLHTSYTYSQVESSNFAEAKFPQSYKQSRSSIDFKLRKKLHRYGITSVTPPPKHDPALIELGQNLFFEKEIAGTRNISCATCHHPFLGSADGQSQSRGQGAVGLGAARHNVSDGFIVDDGKNRSFKFLPRNTLSLWNRGVPNWTVMFWDGRLAGSPEEGFISPAGDATPQNFTSALAAFSIIPVTPDEEMRGFPNQPDALGNDISEFTSFTNDDFADIWPLVTARVTENDAYNDMLAAAFPGVPESDLDITHIAEAIGAFMSDEFTALNSPFDQYLAGNNDALSKNAKRGALLFYGRANCVSCHAGGLQTDFDFYNIGAPQVGTGRGAAAPLDLGRGAITGNAEENFRFRTPSLRNIELEAPYFHNGAFTRLEDAVRHHLNPEKSVRRYDPSQLEPELAAEFEDNNRDTIGAALSTVSPLLSVSGRPLREREVNDLMAFLSALTDPASINKFDVVPDELPSGLPLAD